MGEDEVALGETPVCTDCAACCTSRSLRHASVTGSDWTRLADVAEAMTTWIGNVVFMRMHEGHCAALEAQPNGTFACSVYATRPEVCRELGRGSPACAGEISTKTIDLRRHLPMWSPRRA